MFFGALAIRLMWGRSCHIRTVAGASGRGGSLWMDLVVRNSGVAASFLRATRILKSASYVGRRKVNAPFISKRAVKGSQADFTLPLARSKRAHLPNRVQMSTRTGPQR